MINSKKLWVLFAFCVMAIIAGCCSNQELAPKRAQVPPVAIPAAVAHNDAKQTNSHESIGQAAERDYPWFDREGSVLRATQYLLRINYTNIILKAKSVDTWVDEDKHTGQPVIYVDFSWVFPKGPKGPQDFMVILNRNGQVISAKPAYIEF